VQNGEINKSTGEKVQRAIAAADRAVTGAMRMCEPVALRAAANTLGKRGRAAAAGDAAAVSAALHSARAAVRHAAGGVMTAFVDAHRSIPAGTANGLLEIHRELSAVAGGWIALMVGCRPGLRAQSSGAKVQASLHCG
jgi:hypothetical protein